MSDRQLAILGNAIAILGLAAAIILKLIGQLETWGWYLVVVLLVISAGFFVAAFIPRPKLGVRQKAISKLADLLDEGNNKIFNGKVTSVSDHSRWVSEWGRWQQKVEDHLENQIGHSDKVLFRNLISVPQNNWPQAFDAFHNFELCLVKRQLDRIEEIMDKHRKSSGTR